MKSRGLGADLRGERIARNASIHHDSMICFAWTEKRYGGVEMHRVAIGSRFPLSPAFPVYAIAIGLRLRFPVSPFRRSRLGRVLRFPVRS